MVFYKGSCLMNEESSEYLGLDTSVVNDFEEKDVSYLLKNKHIFSEKKEQITRSLSLNDLKHVYETFYFSQVARNMNYYRSLVWSNEMEKSIQNQQDLHFRLFKKEYLEKISICEDLITHVSKMFEKLRVINIDLKKSYENSHVFRNNYEKLEKEKQNAILLKDQIRQNLEAYCSLDVIYKLLNTSGVELITKPEFFDMLKKLDKGSQMMKEHPEFKNSWIYREKFEQCLTKAMTLICVFFVQVIKELNEGINEDFSFKVSNNINQTAFLYTKFRVRAIELRPYIKEIEERIKDHNEYNVMINDCQKFYFGIRYKLVKPIISQKLNELSNENIIRFSRISIAFFTGLCFDEFSLFRDFFQNDDSKFYSYSQKLFEPISTYLQSNLFKETNLSLLCEVCSVFKVKISEDSENENSLDIGQDCYKIDYSVIFNEIIQHIQSFIVVQVRNVAKLEIQNFIPSKNAFNFSKTLEKRDQSDSLLTKVSDVSKEELYDSDLVIRWYPTLNKTISLLSKIYPLLNTKSFNTVAYDIVNICISSLSHGSQVQTDISMRDRQLFLVKHLLILRNQILEFNIDFFHFEKDVNIDTANISSWDVYNKLRLFNPLELYKSAWSKISGFSSTERDIYNKFNTLLQTAINASIEHSLKPFIEPIQKIRKIKKLSNDSIEAIINESLISIEKEAPLLRITFLSYIEDSQIIHIFFIDIIDKFSKELGDIGKCLSPEYLTTWSQTDQLISCLSRLLLNNNSSEKVSKTAHQDIIMIH
ncbi:hypothetical protein PNEG_03166 [Pneumocystis murina B123]|uniref:Conserved oligomeric Golgi complex subunit 3 n=1 Tax=Pneumocystis murina (strain B123) TaxID=1069680 RepID=M7NMI0_PNEMU|nr:hypothetical protein PNEG_03166 [Pneumocystis murina B123]EMR08326.1 hypothetical protein PNEG_03166 [Pneumocystis murina B123]